MALGTCLPIRGLGNKAMKTWTRFVDQMCLFGYPSIEPWCLAITPRAFRTSKHPTLIRVCDRFPGSISWRLLRLLEWLAFEMERDLRELGC